MRPQFSMAFVAILGSVTAAPAPGQSTPPQRDLGGEVREIFAAKCLECHAASLRQPKGKFGYVLDLPRVAGNPKLVVPGNADHSKLWKLVHDGDMPPDDARKGPLSDAEAETIRAWIVGGAPPPGQMQAAAAPASAPAAVARVERPRRASFLGRVVRLSGKLHVLVVHFPIALLAVAALGETLVIWGRGNRDLVRFCLALGAAGAAVAAALGWVLAATGGFAGGDPTLTVHRWLGTSAAAVALFAFIASERAARRTGRRLPLRAALFTSAILVGISGHFGGMLVYGTDYFRW